MKERVMGERRRALDAGEQNRNIIEELREVRPLNSIEYGVVWRYVGEEDLRVEGVIKSSQDPFRSGEIGSYYVDFDVLISDPMRCVRVMSLYVSEIRSRLSEPNTVPVDFLAFISKVRGPTGAIALSTGLSVAAELPLVFVDMKPIWDLVRVKKVAPELMEPKASSRERLQGKTGLLVLEHCTTGREALSAIRAIRASGGDISDVIAFSVWAKQAKGQDFRDAGVRFRFFYELDEVPDKDTGKPKPFVVIPRLPLSHEPEIEDFFFPLKAQN